MPFANLAHLEWRVPKIVVAKHHSPYVSDETLNLSQGEHLYLAVISLKCAIGVG
jgi:hypothetical protein